jgi:hypothetical protein
MGAGPDLEDMMGMIIQDLSLMGPQMNCRQRSHISENRPYVRTFPYRLRATTAASFATRALSEPGAAMSAMPMPTSASAAASSARLKILLGTARRKSPKERREQQQRDERDLFQRAPGPGHFPRSLCFITDLRAIRSHSPMDGGRTPGAGAGSTWEHPSCMSRIPR